MPEDNESLELHSVVTVVNLYKARCAELEAVIKEAMRLLELVRLDQLIQGSTIMLPWVIEWQEKAKQVMGEENGLSS